MSLRVVSPGDVPRRFTVSSAAAEGSRRDLLVAMRSRVATAVENPDTPARDLASLTRRLMEIAKDIDVLDAKEREVADAGATPDEHWQAI